MSLAPYRIVYLPVGYAESADRIVALVERGVLRVQPHWRSREVCQSFIDSLPGASGERNWYRPTLAIIRVAEGAGQDASPLGVPPSMTERRDGVRGFGKPITESAGQEGMDLCERDAPAVGSRALGVQEVRHVA